MEDWDAIPENQQTWQCCQQHFKTAYQCLVKHKQQTVGKQGYGTAYNAVKDDSSLCSLQDTIAGMNVKHAESLQALSELSQSNHKIQSRNLQLENEVQSL
ncbi:hypothetical protein ACHAXS_002438 [Conticribra weissflogii]